MVNSFAFYTHYAANIETVYAAVTEATSNTN